ncbi:hypothetical protein B0H13DRAFT_1879351 [Mycena leptocephala]|nr:hypothetical protein B0H13DRAFT_1879351 [Mycena leptocephala]
MPLEIMALSGLDFDFAPLLSNAVPLATNLDASTLPVAHGTYAGKVEDKSEKYGSKQYRTLAQLLGLGFRLLKWNGFDARPLVDSKGRVFAALAGQPRKDAVADMRNHRRGLFAVINVGLSYGKGQSIPSWLYNKSYDDLADRLLNDPDIARMAHFASAPLQFTAGRNLQYVDNGFRTERTLEEEDPEEWERLGQLKAERWEMGLGLFSTIDELLGRE